MNRGRFVAFEGAEGVGKTTQIQLLASSLERAGIPLLVTREPGGTSVGEAIRELVLHASGGPVPPETELLLILAARAAFVREVVAPTLAAGKWVLSDRFDLSTFAYQGFGRGIDPERIKQLNSYATQRLRPDLYVVLDLSVDEGMARQARAGKLLDRFESESPAFHQAVRTGYVQLAGSLDRAVLVPADGSPEEVEERIRREIVARFPETFRGRAV